ncbi:GFA family protein [Sphingomonas populi]|uniref:GFA family protein n=1 Tax=Sphingomonas populi TaxID=2484750 RepID=A0A4Q6Y5T3_9SPHN|nr:GFA family protein [Sphingomonas populi]RZF65752.1 GFA family protein [Sphingomonas populi]
MTVPVLPWTAGCRCGGVRFHITKPAMLTVACHCTGCQKMTGSAFSTSIMVPSDGIVVTGDTVRGGLREGMLHHQHCDACKSWVFTRFDPDPGFVNVRATMLDDATWYAPFAETFTSEALPWAKTGARWSFERFPAPEEHSALFAAFAAEAS